MKPFFSIPSAGIRVASTLLLGTVNSWAAPTAASGYQIEALLPSSPFCGVHGLGVDSEDRLDAGRQLLKEWNDHGKQWPPSGTGTYRF